MWAGKEEQGSGRGAGGPAVAATACARTIDTRSRRNQFGSQSGQSLIIVLLALPVLLLFAALIVEGGNLVAKKRQIQTAADAAVLAAAQSLNAPGCDDACIGALATQWSGKNGGDSLHKCVAAADTNCYAWPYKGDDRLVEVRLRKTVSSLFGGLLGTTFHVGARAVASASPLTSVTDPTEDTHTTPGTTDHGLTVTSTTPGTTNTGSVSTNVSTTTVATIVGNGGVAFAKSTACPAISYNGTAKGATMGSFATNGGVRIGGNSDKTINYLGIGKLNVPGCYDNQAGATVNQTFGPFGPVDWPLPLPSVPTPGAGCTNLGSTSMNFTTAGHPPGVYCLTGTTATLTLNADLTGNAGYTFFAPCISVSGGKYQYYGHPNDPKTLFYASAPNASCAAGASISIQGQGATIEGYIFAPNGEVKMQGGGVSAGTGFIESQTLSIQGNSANFQGNGPVIGGSTVVTSTSMTTYPGTTVPESTSTATVPGTTNAGSVSTTTTPGTTVTTGTTVGLDE